jgi:N-acetylmuramoyl-L-alanine amidase
VRWFQQELSRVGYAAPATGVLDKATKNVIRAFQMHYRPSRYDGRPDIETAAILQTLQ